MLRKIMIALAAIVTIGAAGTGGAEARRGGRGWGRGWGPAVGVGIGLGLAAGYPYYGPGYGYGYPYRGYAGGCWRTVRVGTPYGWRWRRVWVC
jgi:hypothetical protein